MSTRRILAILMTLLLGTRLLYAVPEDQPNLQAQVKRLVELLGNPARQVAAETELLQLGPDVLRHLPGPDTPLSTAQKARLKIIRATLTEAAVLKEMTPRTVTLRNPSIPLSKALEQVREQTKMAVVDRRAAGGDDPSLKLNLEKAPFWQAVDTIAREADLQVSLYEKDGLVALREGPHRMLPVSYSGMFRTQAKRLAAVRDLETEARLCTVHLEIAWEPRFQPLFLQSKPDRLEVKDDKGVALSLPETVTGRVPVTGRLSTDVQVLLESPRRTVNNLGLVKGSFSVVGPSKMLTFTFDQLARVDAKTPTAKIPTQTQEGITVRLRRFLTEADLWTVNMQLDYPTDGPDFESFESWLVNNQIFLVNKAGKRFEPGGYEIDEQAGNKASVTYRFVEDNGLVLGKPEQWKLLYTTPGMIVKVPIHFEFKNLPLP